MTNDELKSKIIKVLQELRASKPIVPNDYGLQIISCTTDREIADALVAEMGLHNMTINQIPLGRIKRDGGVNPMDYVKKYEEEANAKIKELQEIKKTIKPCPFCGKPVELLNLCYGSGNYGSGSHFVICCSNCKLDMEGPDTSWTHFYDHNNEVRKFVEKWNTRCGGEHDDE